MDIIKAVWEKRNLGVSATEVQFDVNDNFAEVSEEFNNIEDEYVVVRVPTTRNDISHMVQGLGYSYIEDIIHVEHDLHEVQRSAMHQRLYEATDYRRMTEDDKIQLYNEISDGMFSSDRISNDPYFDDELVVKRYYNWFTDLVNKGGLPYVILYKGDPAGFIILMTKDGRLYNSVLGGGYRKYRNTGLGIVQKEQEIVRELGGKRLETLVSSNNPGQLRALEINGYRTKNINHIYIKHNKL